MFIVCYSYCAALRYFKTLQAVKDLKKNNKKKQMQYSCCKSFTTLPTQNSEVAQNHNYKKKKIKK